MQSTRTYKQYSAIADLHNLQFTVTHALGFSVFTSRILVMELNSLTVTKSSNNTLRLHRLTSNSSTNFPWLSPTDNAVVLLQFPFSHCCTPCTPCTLLCSWTLNSTTELTPNYFLSRYIDSGRISRKTRVTCQNACSLARYPAVGMARTT
jgi:hypothetical protein